MAQLSYGGDYGSDLAKLEGKTFITYHYDEVIIRKSKGKTKFYPAGKLLDKKVGRLPSYSELKYLK